MNIIEKVLDVEFTGYLNSAKKQNLKFSTSLVGDKIVVKLSPFIVGDKFNSYNLYEECSLIASKQSAKLSNTDTHVSVKYSYYFQLINWENSLYEEKVSADRETEIKKEVLNNFVGKVHGSFSKINDINLSYSHWEGNTYVFNRAPEGMTHPEMGEYKVAMKVFKERLGL